MANDAPPLPHPPARHLLLIDDDEDVTYLLQSIFRSDQVTVCATGAAALSVVGQGTPVDVVLCDLALPDMDGVALFAALCARRPALADCTLFVSGGALSEAVEVALAKTGCPVLAKPFMLADVVAAVQAVYLASRGAAGPQTR